MFFHPKGADLCPAVCGSYKKGRTNTLQGQKTDKLPADHIVPAALGSSPRRQVQSPLAWDVSVVDGVIQALLPREDLKRAPDKLQDSEMDLTVPLLPFWFSPIQLCPGKWPPGFSHSLTPKAGSGEMKPELPMKPIPHLL